MGGSGFPSESIKSEGRFPGLYVHVPFCRRKCAYCSFYSITALHLIPNWLRAVSQEARLYEERFGRFDTLYLGGGTPSILTVKQLAVLLEVLRPLLVEHPQPEITLEANPDDVTPGQLAGWRDLGINRLSLGVQSFADHELSFLGRRHQASGSRRALELSRVAFANLSVDLMYGLPGQSQKAWVEHLKQALEFEPEHLSCYQLSVEKGTPLGHLMSAGRFTPLPTDWEGHFFLLTSRFLEKHGYLHYEVSNFARGNCWYARHNKKYWQQTPYLGLGPGAHSFLGNKRWWNFRSVARYCEALKTGRAPVAGSETLTEGQLRLETLFLGFRTREGVKLEMLGGQPEGEKNLWRLEKAGLVRVEEGWVRPTRQGMLVADSLALLF